MFSALKQSWAQGVAYAKLRSVLESHYNLAFNHPWSVDLLRGIVDRFPGYNEHEQAVQFLAEFTAVHIQPGHPRADIEIQRYLRVAHSAYQNEAANELAPYHLLLTAARERFGVMPEWS